MGRSPRELRIRRHTRVRFKVVGHRRAPARRGQSRSNRHISAQIIDDDAGRTLAAASSNEAALRDGTKTPKQAAEAVGTLLGQRAKDAGITTIVFDRGGFAYHGRVAALADALRKEGVEF